MTCGKLVVTCAEEQVACTGGLVAAPPPAAIPSTLHPVPCRLLFLLILAALPTVAAPKHARDLTEQLESARQLRPRLLLLERDVPELRRRLHEEPALQGRWADLLAQADETLATEPVKRQLDGRRLLGRSRTALARVLQLSLAWRITDDRKYSDRAVAELEAIAAFSDWNPSHFLDVAEMTTAAAFGYDWLHAVLNDSQRARIRSAMIEKGLRPSLTFDDWTRVSNNWNPVCNAGMVLGALAVVEHEPQLAAELIQRAVATVPLALHEYAPDGAYPEGASYWSYGTSFTVLLLSALETVFGSDFGLSEAAGFLATADYFLHVTGPTGQMFNYGDAFEGAGGRSPAMPWFALRRRQPYLLWHELSPSADTPSRDRLSPLGLLWLASMLQIERVGPPETWWVGRGVTPVAFHRSDWNRGGTYVAIKGGSPSVNHGHMDVGTFVLEADGQRWAEDLGADSYQALEAAGLNLWDNDQESDRWKVFRLATASHNVLQIDGQQQRVSGQAPIVRSEQDLTIVDLSPVYAGQLARARRGIRLQPDRSVVVQDEIRALDAPAGIRWAMLTRAEVKIISPREAMLQLKGEKLLLRVIEPAGVNLETFASDPPPSPFDSPNPGTRHIGFTLEAGPSQPERCVIHFVPGRATVETVRIRPLDQW